MAASPTGRALSCSLIRRLGLVGLVEHVNAEWNALIGNPILAHTFERRDHATVATKHVVGERDEQPVWDRRIG